MTGLPDNRWSRAADLCGGTFAESGRSAACRDYRRRPLIQTGSGTGGVGYEATAQMVSSGVWSICWYAPFG